MMNDKLIRLRFIFVISHLVVLLVTLIWRKEAIARDVFPLHDMFFQDAVRLKLYEQQLEKKTERLAIILGAGVGLISVEMCLFLIGLSMFKHWQCLFSFLCHLSGTCSSLYLLYQGWVEEIYIVIFILCIMLPVITEGFILIRYILKHV